LTAIVGVMCRDGVVIGTDSSVTFGSGQMRTIEQTGEKIEVVGGRVIVAETGSVGLNQRFCAIVGRHWHDKRFTGSPIDVAKGLCIDARQDFASTGVKEGLYSPLVAFPCSKKPYLCEFDGQLQPEFKDEKLWYCSLGSSQSITDPFLGFMRDVFWTGGPPTVQDAVFVVTWALQHAIAVNPGGVNAPVRIAALEKKGNDYEARVLDDAELDEHRQSIEEAMGRLRDFRTSLQSAPATEIPTADD
jgi:hypothetical protein